MNTVVELVSFERRAKDAGMSDEDIVRLIGLVARKPEAGDLIVGTGGARKRRFARENEGKSGGFRVLTYFVGSDLPVFLLTVLAKSQRANFSKAERNQLRVELAGLAEDYRNGAIYNVRTRKTASR